MAVVAGGVARSRVTRMPRGGWRCADAGHTAHLGVAAIASLLLLHLHLVGIELPEPGDDQGGHDGAVVVLDEAQHEHTVPAQVVGRDLAGEAAHLGHAYESSPPEAEANVGESVAAEGAPHPEQ